MIVRLFQPQFAGLVESGAKRQTVRPTPKRMPKPGDKISLRAWTGLPYRSKQRILRESEVTSVITIYIDETPTDFVFILDGQKLNAEEWPLFARADGFDCTTDLLDWFRINHGLPFSGNVIYWR